MWTSLRMLVSKLRDLFSRRREDREFADELDTHFSLLIDENVRRGMPLEEATRQAKMRLGGLTQTREMHRELHGFPRLESFFQDLRFATRLFRRSPSLALTAIAVLALGIGVNVAAFSIFDIMCLRPLPVRNPHSLYRFMRKSGEGMSTSMPWLAVDFYRRNDSVLSAVLAQTTEVELALDAATGERVKACFVTGNYFTELGATPAYGRLLDAPADEAPDAPLVAVLSHSFWQRRFGGDTSIVGRTIRLNSQPVTVIGVAPYDFTGLDPRGFDAWLPITQHPALVRGSSILTSFDSTEVEMFGRLRTGISSRAAEQGLQPLVDELIGQQPKYMWKDERLTASPGAYASPLDASQHVPELAFMSSLVLLILVIACANLGNLLLAHSVSRERELWIRGALGASRGRLIRQLLTESLLLGICGSALGLALSLAATKLILGAANAGVFLSVTPDARTIAFTFGIGVLASVVFGLAPALKAGRAARRAGRTRHVFIGLQVAASCILLIVSALLVRALQRALTADPGFEYKQALILDPELYDHGYSPAAAAQFFRDLQERLRSVPGIEMTSLVTMAPLGNRVSIMSLPGHNRTRIFLNRVDADYFRTMGITLLRGRNFVPNERNAAIVSESLANQLWPGQDALGKPFSGTETIVGIARSARTNALRNSDAVEAYLNLRDIDFPNAVLVVKATHRPEEISAQLVATARSLAADLHPRVELLHESFRLRTQEAQFGALMATSVGSLALFLACLGLYGVVSYTVGQRTKEIGIRMALGAMPRQVLRCVIAQFVRPAVVAVVAGTAAAVALSVALRSALYGISNLDPLSYFAAILTVCVVGAGAALLAARRATRVDPASALRHE